MTACCWCVAPPPRASPLAAAVTLSYFQRARAAGWGPLEVLQQVRDGWDRQAAALAASRLQCRDKQTSPSAPKNCVV